MSAISESDAAVPTQETTDQELPASGSRREDREAVTGRRKYTGDLDPENGLHAAIYRSPHAHADIVDVDLTDALALDGVVGGFTGDSLPEYVLPMTAFQGMGADLQPNTDEVPNPQIRSFPHRCLARDRVRYVGEPVAVVVTEDRYVAEDALDVITAEYELRPAVVDEEAALESDGPLVYEEWEDNKLLEFDLDAGDVESAFDDAEYVIEEEIRHHRFTATPMETRAVTASYDEGDAFIDLHTSTQVPDLVANFVENCLDLSDAKVQVHAGNVGGGFGPKTGVYPEELLVSALAIHFDRPVKWVELRREHMIATSHAREQTHHIRAAVAADGEILGIEDEAIVNSGVAYPTAASQVLVATARFIPGVYRVQNYRCKMYGMATNKTPIGAHRGFGKAGAAYVSERLADLIADRIGMDPAELRRRNFVQPDEFPYDSAGGNNYDSGNYPAAFDRALELVDYDGWRREQTKRLEADADRLIGIGMAVCLEPSSAVREGSIATPGYYAIRMRIDSGGQVFVFLEDPDIGTSHKTSVIKIVADGLDADPDTVRVVQGDTLLCPTGSGSYSSRFSVVGTTAAYEVTDRMATRLRRIAAAHLDESVDDLVLEGGTVTSRVTGASLTIKQLAHLAYHVIDELPADMDPGLELTHYSRSPNIEFHKPGTGRAATYSTHPYTADIGVIEVDRETGHFEIEDYVTVHDCGTILNEKIVEGQHLGALAHGIGGALYEELPYDAGGNPLHRSFMDYLVPTAVEMPEVRMEHQETPSPFTPGGHKGGGETGTVSPPPVFANAVFDVLRSLEDEPVEMPEQTPMTPSYVWEKLRSSS